MLVTLIQEIHNNKFLRQTLDASLSRMLTHEHPNAHTHTHVYPDLMVGLPTDGWTNGRSGKDFPVYRLYYFLSSKQKSCQSDS